MPAIIPTYHKWHMQKALSIDAVSLYQDQLKNNTNKDNPCSNNQVNPEADHFVTGQNTETDGLQMLKQESQ